MFGPFFGGEGTEKSKPFNQILFIYQTIEFDTAAKPVLKALRQNLEEDQWCRGVIAVAAERF
jgi:hypothetical protein